MRIIPQTTAAAIAVALGALSAGPALAKVYNVVFAGKSIPVDCPESPEGHNMTWVSHNCTAVRVAPQGTSTVAADRAGLLGITEKN